MKKFILLAFILLIAFGLSGCIKIKKNGEQQSVGGIYQSINFGKTWISKNDIASTPQKPGSISNLNITEITIDPSDPTALYIGTEANGLFVSYNNAENWIQFPALSTGYIHSIAVHPGNKCVIYVTTNNKILKTLDCGRTYREIFFDTRPTIILNTIVIDAYDPNILYAGNSEGDILKSADGGTSWTTIKRTESAIKKIILGADTRTVFVATSGRGVYKSINKGESWVQYRDKINEIGNVSKLTNMVYDVKNKTLIISTGYGLLRSNDEGETWEAINLITAPDTTVIYSLAVNPINANEIYYGTASTFYKSSDGGKSWISEKLPAPSIANKLLVNPANPDIIYLGLKKIQKDKSLSL